MGDGDILYKYSSTSSISFPSTVGILDNTDNYQDITSTKQNFTDEVLILYNLDHSSLGGPAWWYGTKADASPFPVELAFFSGVLNGTDIELKWRPETEVNNYGFNIERSLPSTGTIWKNLYSLFEEIVDHPLFFDVFGLSQNRCINDPNFGVLRPS